MVSSDHRSAQTHQIGMRASPRLGQHVEGTCGRVDGELGPGPPLGHVDRKHCATGPLAGRRARIVWPPAAGCLSASAACPSGSRGRRAGGSTWRRPARTDSGIRLIQPMTVAISPRSNTSEPLATMTSTGRRSTPRPGQEAFDPGLDLAAGDMPVRCPLQQPRGRVDPQPASGSGADRGRGDGIGTTRVGCPAPPGTSIPASRSSENALRIRFAGEMADQFGTDARPTPNPEQQPAPA